jgi:hypothetical protein
VAPDPFRRRRAWRELEADSYSALERRARRRLIAYGAWSLTVLAGIVIAFAQNGTA